MKKLILLSAFLLLLLPGCVDYSYGDDAYIVCYTNVCHVSYEGDPIECNFFYPGGTGSNLSEYEAWDGNVKFRANRKWEIRVPDYLDWFTVTPLEGEGDAVLKFTFSPNDGDIDRVVTIRIKEKNMFGYMEQSFTIKQFCEDNSPQ